MASHRFWSHPVLPIGLFLTVLGIGNWWVSRDKVAEYSKRIEASETLQAPDLSAFAHLDFRTNQSLLRRLHRAPTAAGFAAGKRDFYMLINNGGRLIALLGLTLTAIGLVRFLDDRGHGSRRHSAG